VAAEWVDAHTHDRDAHDSSTGMNA
jgi:hypothetical protein